MWYIKRKYRQIKRIFEFFPLIWNGADFDYRYAIDLFTYQLSRTADYLEKKNRHKFVIREYGIKMKPYRKVLGAKNYDYLK